MAYFPMFINLEKKSCLVVGGGSVAARKVLVLRDFGAEITVVAPVIAEKIKELPSVAWRERAFLEEDLLGCDLVVAATDDKEKNHEIASLAHHYRIPVNVVSQAEDSSFLFPSYVKKGELVGAFSSGGQSPAMTQYLKSVISEVLTDDLGALSECLGSVRQIVKETVEEEADRKKVYQEILEIGLSQEGLPTGEQIEQVLDKYRNR